MRKQTELQKKIQELQLKHLRRVQGQLSRGSDAVPFKRDTRIARKNYDSFAENLKGVPGGGHKATSVVKMIAAATTGTKTASFEKQAELELRSSQNANTTSGPYGTVW